jgi:hypothetical protein
MSFLFLHTCIKKWKKDKDETEKKKYMKKNKLIAVYDLIIKESNNQCL